MSYLRTLKTGLVVALRETFDATYPEETLRDLHVSIEYPVDQQDYPSIWVDYDDSSLQTAGIDHIEIADDGTRTLRWRFQGYATYTIAALSSLERDRIYDELVKVIAFSRSSESAGAFRQYIENNDLIALNFDFDQIEPHGSNASPGTPWQTDEMIYERTIAMQVLGEFNTNIDTGTLVPLSKIVIDGRQWPSTEANPDGLRHAEITQNNVPAPYDPYSWH